MTQKIGRISGVLLASVIFAGLAEAQSPYRVEYFAKATTTGLPDATLRLDNDGSAGDKDLCADIFVFDANEEISECCSCLETPDDLLTIDINKNLLSSPVNGVPLGNGLIMIVAAGTTGGDCPVPTHITTVARAEIQGWATHVQDNGTLTEAASQVSNLSSAQESRLGKLCGAILAVTTPGICNCAGAGN